MKKNMLFAVLYMAAFAALGQQTTKNFSLRQAIDYALTSNTEIKNATIDEYIAKSKVAEYIGTGLPQVSAAVGVQHAKPLRRIFGVGTGEFNFLANSVVPAGEVFSLPNFFQLSNTADAGLNFSQLLFSSSYFVGLKAAKTYQELAVIGKESTKIEVTANVTKAYYMALINFERKNLFDLNITRVDSLLAQTRALNKSGFAEKIDVDRLEVTFNNLVTEKAKFDNLLLLSAISLKYQMNMPFEEELILTDKITDLQADPLVPTTAKIDFGNRIEYKALATQNRLQELNYKNNVYSFLPSIAFSGSIGVFTQSPNFDFHTRSSNWYDYGVYGLGLNMPIFTGFTRLRKVQQAKFELQKSQNSLKQFELTVSLQAKAAEISYQNSIKSLQAQQRNMELAKEVARVTRIKFVSGTGPNIEVINAESALKEAQINYYNSLYDALVYKVDYEKALGNLK